MGRGGLGGQHGRRAGEPHGDLWHVRAEAARTVLTSPALGCTLRNEAQARIALLPRPALRRGLLCLHTVPVKNAQSCSLPGSGVPSARTADATQECEECICG